MAGTQKNNWGPLDAQAAHKQTQAAHETKHKQHTRQNMKKKHFHKHTRTQQQDTPQSKNTTYMYTASDKVAQRKSLKMGFIPYYTLEV